MSALADLMQRGCLLLLLALVCTVPAHAVRVESIYSAETEMPAGNNALGRAFEQALSRVLVKVTGMSSLGSPAARRSLTTDAAALVRQYSRLADNRIRVDFDGAAVRRLLDSAGQPVWGADRPLLAVWYAIDAGNGQREILSGEAEPARRGRIDARDSLREQLLAAAEERGLPVVLPLVDAEDLGRVSFADVWGDFREPLLAASRRYGADAVLIGRARSRAADAGRVRWTLATRNDYQVWEGSVSDGPVRAAEYLSQRLATFADASGALHVVIANVGSLDDFGRISRYLRSLSIIEDATVAAVRADNVEFELQVRGDRARLRATLAANSLLAEIPDAALPASGRRPDLSYRWTGRDQPAP